MRLARRWSDPGQLDPEAIARIGGALGSIAGDNSREAALLRLRLQAHLAKKLSFAVSQDTVAPQSALDESAPGETITVAVKTGDGDAAARGRHLRPGVRHAVRDGCPRPR
jgi:hypothetical protein